MDVVELTQAIAFDSEEARFKPFLMEKLLNEILLLSYRFLVKCNTSILCWRFLFRMMTEYNMYQKRWRLMPKIVLPSRQAIEGKISRWGRKDFN